MYLRKHIGICAMNEFIKKKKKRIFNHNFIKMNIDWQS